MPSQKPEDLQKIVFQIIENQINDNDPIEVAQTYRRLQAAGYNNEETYKLIGCALSVELFEITKHNNDFDQSRYIENLKKLPKLPWEDE